MVARDTPARAGDDEDAGAQRAGSGPPVAVPPPAPPEEGLHRVRLPRRREAAPPVRIARRVLIALAIVAVNWGIVMLERGEYRDALDEHITAIDALYYTTVSLTTTGYGDITPVTQGARLLNAMLVTPMRLLFVLVLVGTTIQVLTERSREQFRINRWRSRLHDHVVVCGYGTKGRSAVQTLLDRDWPKDKIVVIDRDPAALADAASAGVAAVAGAATRDDVLRQAGAQSACAVIVATDQDDTSVLVTLSARRLNPRASIIATAREAENAPLLSQSGADSVITSSASVGRLLGIATTAPKTVDLVEDLLVFGQGLDIAERDVRADEHGRGLREVDDLVLGVIRGGSVLPFSDPAAAPLRAGDRLIVVTTDGRNGG